jgi:hypothetical protein
MARTAATPKADVVSLKTGKTIRRGRPRLEGDDARTEWFGCRLTASEARRLADLGGTRWFRNMLANKGPKT